jgi:hypothetical protein
MSKFIVVFETPHHKLESKTFSTEQEAKDFKAEHPDGKFAAVVKGNS